MTQEELLDLAAEMLTARLAENDYPIEDGETAESIAAEMHEQSGCFAGVSDDARTDAVAAALRARGIEIPRV